MADEALRIARSEQAKAAMEQFLRPALMVVSADYLTKLADIAAKPLDDKARAGMEKLALALKVVEQVTVQIEALIHDGSAARADKQRADKIASLPAEKRRWM